MLLFVFSDETEMNFLLSSSETLLEFSITYLRFLNYLTHQLMDKTLLPQAPKQSLQRMFCSSLLITSQVIAVPVLLERAATCS